MYLRSSKDKLLYRSEASVPLVYSFERKFKQKRKHSSYNTPQSLYSVFLVKMCLSISFLFPSLHTASPSGKLSVVEHRCSILSAIQTLALCPLSSSGMTNLATFVSESLVTHIKQEGTFKLSILSVNTAFPPVNSGTIMAAGNVLRVWCGHLVEKTPKSLIDLLKVCTTCNVVN